MGHLTHDGFTNSALCQVDSTLMATVSGGISDGNGSGLAIFLGYHFGAAVTVPIRRALLTMCFIFLYIWVLAPVMRKVRVWPFN
jgi:hypothetical protein